MADKSQLVVSGKYLYRAHPADGEIYSGTVSALSPNGQFVQFYNGRWLEISKMTVLDTFPAAELKGTETIKATELTGTLTAGTDATSGAALPGTVAAGDPAKN